MFERFKIKAGKSEIFKYPHIIDEISVTDQLDT